MMDLTRISVLFFVYGVVLNCQVLGFVVSSPTLPMRRRHVCEEHVDRPCDMRGAPVGGCLSKAQCVELLSTDVDKAKVEAAEVFGEQCECVQVPRHRNTASFPC